MPSEKGGNIPFLLASGLSRTPNPFVNEVEDISTKKQDREGRFEQRSRK